MIKTMVMLEVGRNIRMQDASISIGLQLIDSGSKVLKKMCKQKLKD